MSVVVVGAGRSGTNMALEILRGHPYFNASKNPENKGVFKKGETFPDNYLTKCDTIYFTYPDITQTLNKNKSIKLLWTIRDPRDMLMSKLRRGAPKKDGGDNHSVADDGTPKGAIQDLFNMMDKYILALFEFKQRMVLVKMEDMILKTEITTRFMCNIFNIPYYHEMLFFYKRMRNKNKARRYKGIDKSQIEMWKNWKTAYDGWLLKKGFDMEKLFKEIEPITEYFGY